MRASLIKNNILLLFLLASFFGYAQSQLVLTKGRVTDSLVVPDTKNTFSIYLPRTYDKNKSWPIIFGFDSSNRTSNIARFYQAAAEELGYIIAVTNFTEEQSARDRANYVAVFMKHIFSLFPIQIGRVYVTGVGDDAKFASLLPLGYPDKIFGVIAIGDSYFYDSRINLNKNFTHFGILNTHNYRFKNFQANKNFLKRRAVPADLFVYEGGGEFPAQELIKNVLTALTRQAMLKGRVAKDSIWIQNSFEKSLQEVDGYVSKRKFLKAYEELKRIRIDYNQFFDTDYLKEKQKEIKKLNGFRKEKRLRSKYAIKENYLRESYLFSAEEDIALLNYSNLGWWQYEMSKLDTLIAKKEKYGHDMAIRVKRYVNAIINNYKITAIKENVNLEAQLFLNIFSTIVNKEDFDSYKKIISLSARDLDNETALFYLEKMLQNGYRDFDALYEIEGTLALKITKKYNELIEKYLGNSKYFFSK
ncbi:hypothetical protein [Aquimarina spongiae]|uniref:Uncharacterized protein n=1 Tax=Aquimarina spongiae TaxID=570521 RepID=A0A1M6KB96_9FLAO|nr:hypothetical protein [Aquimarina spongiae]SHJ56169.1 hypothetical protein SAMN04488508_110176 [Aquimarina spongiae]